MKNFRQKKQRVVGQFLDIRRVICRFLVLQMRQMNCPGRIVCEHPCPICLKSGWLPGLRSRASIGAAGLSDLTCFVTSAYMFRFRSRLGRQQQRNACISSAASVIDGIPSQHRELDRMRSLRFPCTTHDGGKQQWFRQLHLRGLEWCVFSPSNISDILIPTFGPLSRMIIF